MFLYISVSTMLNHLKWYELSTINFWIWLEKFSKLTQFISIYNINNLCFKSNSVPIILVGNKVDLHLERCVSYQEGKDLANYMKAQFVEVSAKENMAVNSMFQTLILNIEKQSLAESPENTQEKHNKCIVSWKCQMGSHGFPVSITSAPYTAIPFKTIYGVLLHANLLPSWTYFRLHYI